MKNNKSFFRVIITFVIVSVNYFNCNAQQINGVVTDSFNKPLQAVNILIISNKDKSTILEYTNTNKQGNYSIDLKNNQTSFIIEFRLMSFFTKTVEIKDLVENRSPYIVNVKLNTDITALKEVTITSIKNEGIHIKKDTVTFDPNRFKDGTERVVEDLIKKLPGMKVEDNGKIYFKGNAVENILLDGDDLFDKNYTMGSRNIDVDMVDKLAAIENYIENPLLHGIEKSKAVAINLILKKGKTDFSNNSSIGLGVDNKQNLKHNTLGVSKKLKSFSTLSYNNIGEENSQYDYFSSNNISLEDIADNELKLPKILDDINFISEIKDNRARINNNFFTSINTIYNLSDKIGVRLNFDFKKDKLLRNVDTQTDYFDEINATSITQNEAIVKRPKITAVNFKLNYKLSKKELIEYKTKIETSSINTTSFILLNDTNQTSKVIFNEKKINQSLNYTKRLRKNKALVSTILFNVSKLPQNLLVSPDSRFDNSEAISSQGIDLQKTSFNFETTFLTSTKNTNSKIGFGYTFEKNEFASLLKINEFGTETNISQNNFIFQNSYPWFNGSIKIKKGKWRFSSGLSIKYLSEKLIDNNENLNSQKLKHFLIEPKIDVSYVLNKLSNINLVGGYYEKTLDVDNLYTNTIFTSNLNAANNVVNLETIKSYSAKLGYNKNDFYNLFQLNFGLNLLRQRNNFISNISFNDLYIQSTKNLVDVNFDTAFLSLNLEKYLNLIKSNFKINATYGINTYKNVIENDIIRDNSSYNGYYSFALKTGFLKLINFENIFEIQTSSFKTNSLKGIQNVSFQNTFKLHLKPSKRLRIVSSFDFYLPDNSSSENYYFIDNSIFLTSKNEKFNYSLTSRNLTAKRSSYVQKYNSDYFKTSTSYNLLKPYIMLTVDFKF